MKLAFEHDWSLSPREARALQQEIAPRVIRRDQLEKIETVGGVDVGFENAGRITRAAVVVMNAQTLERIDEILHREPTRFPYVPGLLSFREIPALLGALEQLSELPDLLLCDGQGIAHPRRLGIAAHLGVITGIPAIGVGKSRLTGTFEEPGNLRGDWSALKDRRETIGRVLRTRANVKPVFVSTGHRVSLPTATRFVLRFTTRYRLPEPIRAADRLSSSRSS
ncbi:MAG: deoxyribonuclease V [Proteobacteria bacterium]|nr:deoxyribonuclease V [Pseudomonadota bacterium]